MDEAWEFIQNTSELVGTEAIWKLTKRTGYMFYIMNPKEHVFEKLEQVPDYYKEVTPSFMIVIMLEAVFRFLGKKPLLRVNDTITNICQGMIVEIFKIPLQGVELIVYMWIYSNFRITTLPWDSVWTWLIGMVGADFFFYWMHRATHQISFLWNFHEPHHSSEDYNLTTPMRLSVLTSSNFWYTYFPLAVAIPPQVFLVHYQLVIIYQYWLHLEMIPPLGALEYVLNTPSLHKVHHGRNRRCIDKNFGSIFSLWDVMFGTFERETEDDIKYGVTTPLKSFNTFWIQTNFLWPMCKKFLKVKGAKNKLWCLVKGPGWSPGSPWLGKLEDIPEPSPDEKKYDPEISVWMKAYAIIHCGAVVLGYSQLIFNIENLPSFTVFSGSFFIIISAMSFGGIFDDRPWVPFLEISRCLLYFVTEEVILKELKDIPLLTELYFKAYRLLFLLTLSFWLVFFSSAMVFRTPRIKKLLHSD